MSKLKDQNCIYKKVESTTQRGGITQKMKEETTRF